MASVVASEVDTSSWLIITVSDARSLGEAAMSSCRNARTRFYG